MTKISKHKYNVAVLGATGLVGETMLSILAERKFPIDNIYALASARSSGSSVLFGNKTLDVLDVADFDFSKVDIALFSAGASVSAEYAPKAAAAGCVVIDNTSYFRNEPDIPLVIPEVNPGQIANFKARNIIANPNCSTIQMLVALKPIYDAVGIKSITVATYQSVSGTGRAAISELIDQSAQLFARQRDLHGGGLAGQGLTRGADADRFLDAKRFQGNAGRAGAQPSTISKLVLISAVLPSMIVAEQYFSCDMAMARATAASGNWRPRTMKCRWILVKTLGSVVARSLLTFNSQPVTSCRPRLRISTTS